MEKYRDSRCRQSLKYKAQEEWEQVMGEAQANGIDIEIEPPNLKDPQEWAIEELSGVVKKDLLHTSQL